MQTKNKVTTYERAMQEVAGFFYCFFNTVRQQIAFSGKSENTFYNYIHRIALVFTF